MTRSGINPAMLVPVGKVLLMGFFGTSLVQAMKSRQDLSLPFERLVIGFLGLQFFQQGASMLSGVSDQLTDSIARIGGQEDLRSLILEAFKRAADESTLSGRSTSFNLPAVLEQAWRTGVWGVMTAFVEGVFLIVSFVLECAQEVMWKLLLFLFPLAAGAYPVFPRLMGNLIVHAVELSLWFPMLYLVQLVTGSVARAHMVQSGSWGLYVVAVQIIASILILLIPSIVHRFLSGAFSGDFNSQTGVFVQVKRVVQYTTQARATGAMKGSGGRP